MRKFEKGMKRKITLVFVIVCLILSGIICIGVFLRKPNQITRGAFLSPSGEEIALELGHFTFDRRPFKAKTRLYVIKLKPDSEIPEIIRTRFRGHFWGKTWRLGVSEPELSMVAVEKDEPSRLISLKLSNGVSVSSSYSIEEGLLVPQLAWNPRGDILAAFVGGIDMKPKSCLGISYDEGKNIEVTGIEIRGGKLVWADDEKLYLQNEEDIFEVDVSDQKARVTRTIISADGVHLAGSFKGKVIYTLGNELYLGDKLLYSCEKGFRGVHVDGPYIGFSADGRQIIIVNSQGEVINKRDIEHDMRFMGISSRHGFVYLRREKRCIERYSFVEDGELTTVFCVVRD